MSEGRDPCVGDHCITCGDVASEVEVLQVDEQRGLALCAGDEGAHVTVEVALIGTVAPGDRLLVHAGVALAHAPVGGAA